MKYKVIDSDKENPLKKDWMMYVVRANLKEDAAKQKDTKVLRILKIGDENKEMVKNIHRELREQ